MSEVNLQFTVNEFSTAFTANTNEISFNPVPTELSIYTGYTTFAPGGSANSDQVLYNYSGAVQSNVNFTYTQSSSTLEVVNLIVNSDTNLGAVGNVTITGGNAGQYLTTDGTGNISFATLTPGGANTELQYNDNGTFGGIANTSYDGVNLLLGDISNIQITGSFPGQVIKAGSGGVLEFSSYAPAAGDYTTLQYNNSGELGGIPNVTFTAGNLRLGNVANVKLNGGTNGYVLQTDGTGNLTWTAQTGGGGGNGSPGGANTQIQYNDAGSFGGDAGFTYDYLTNSMDVENIGVVNLTATGTTTIQQGLEKVTIDATGLTGNVNWDLLNGAILYYTSNATGNVTMNFRGNSTTTLNTVMTTGQSLTVALLTTIGANVYIPSIKIDGTAQTVKYIANITPSNLSVLTNSLTCYNYTIIKTASATYTVIGNFNSYQ
jgi:hypothetical protein